MRNDIRRLFTIFGLLAVLTACAGESGEWRDWISDLLKGAAPTVQAPPTPGLAPTPTLASDPGEQPGALDDAPDAPAETTSEPASQATVAPDVFGPFTGAFVGTMEGDNDSSAPLQLDIVQRGNQIEGAAALGDGLIVRAGVCGSFPIPAITLNAADEVDEAGERRLSTSTTVAVSGFEIPVELEATLSADGQTVNAEATMHPPALCRASPTVTAVLTRVEQ